MAVPVWLELFPHFLNGQINITFLDKKFLKYGTPHEFVPSMIPFRFLADYKPRAMGIPNSHALWGFPIAYL